MSNKLLIGLTDKTECLLETDRPFLWIDDDPPEVSRGTYFDPSEHSFNPLEDIDYRKARDIAALLYSLSPEGENTLTVRNGRRALARLLLAASRLDRIKAASDDDKDAVAMVDDVLFSPVLKRIFCGKPNFDFSPTKTILTRVNRAELGDFDALILGNFLIGQYQGQVILPDGGFYLRPLHASLIRQNRLIAGVRHLAELHPKLRDTLLLAAQRTPMGCLYEDAEQLALLDGLQPSTVGFSDYVQKAMEGDS
ncbi:MAG TPA: hypothetical protein VGG11_13685 [Xanthobacteraceae bacterium]|jgi:hypothetical protein